MTFKNISIKEENSIEKLYVLLPQSHVTHAIW